MVLLPTLKAFLFVSNNLLHSQLQSVQYDLQHDFAWMADVAYHSGVLALLQAAFLGKCPSTEFKRLVILICRILPQIVVRAVTTSPLLGPFLLGC